MNEDHQTQTDTHRIDPYEDEIELMDYLLVIWKWKYLILVGTLVCGLIAFAISITTPNPPKKYQVEMVLAPGVKEIDENGKKVYIDSPANIQSSIEEVKYKVLNDLKSENNPNLYSDLDYEIKRPKNTNQINIFYETQFADEGIKKLNYLSKALLNHYSEVFKYLKKEYENEIQLKKSYLSRLKTEELRIKIKIEEDIQSKKDHLANLKEEEQKNIKKISRLKKRIDELTPKVKMITENTEQLAKQSKNIVKDSSQNDILSHILTSNILQQNLSIEESYRNQMRSCYSTIVDLEFQLKKNRKEIGKVAEKIEQLGMMRNDAKLIPLLYPNLVDKKSLIEIVTIEIEDLEKAKKNIQNIQILQSPRATPLLIKPVRTKRNVLLASIVGLFLMLFMAFYLEYISKYKNREKRAEG